MALYQQAGELAAIIHKKAERNGGNRGMDKWQVFKKFEDGWLKARIGRRKNTGKPLSAENIEYITDWSIYVDQLSAMAEWLNSSGIITADAAREAVRRYKRSMGVCSVRVCE